MALTPTSCPLLTVILISHDINASLIELQRELAIMSENPDDFSFDNLSRKLEGAIEQGCG